MSLDIKKGTIVYRLNEEFIITNVIDFNYVFAKNTATYEVTRLLIKDLSSNPLNTTKVNNCEDLSLIPPHKLKEAKKRYDAIEPILGLHSRKKVVERAKELNVSPTTLYNWMRDYESSGQLSSLVTVKIKGGKDKSRLTKEQDEIIDIVLQEDYLSNQKLTVSRVYEIIVSKCMNADIKSPSEISVRRRVNALKEKLTLKSREGKKAVEKFDINKDEYPDGLYPLHVLQIDHTLVDIILVDDKYRQELGRPWITVAIDIYSRMITGYYISFESPGYFATGQTLVNSMLPKDHILEQYDIKSQWTTWGIPTIIHMDNAKEFRGLDLQHVCLEYGIDIIWRPVTKPRYGAHIERLLGTLSNHIHTLEGTTFSNTVKKRDYDSQGKANMTLAEFEKWLTILIVDVYHNKVHSALNMPPIKKYENGIFGTNNQPPRGLPKRIEDEQFLRVNLLPKQHRTIQKYGIQIDTIYYYSDVLSQWIDAYEMVRGKKLKKKFLIRRDPRDISNIWFFDPKANKYYLIPYRNSNLPKASIWEFRAAQKFLKNQDNREYDESETFIALERMRKLALESKNKTKAHRKTIDRVAKLEQKVAKTKYKSNKNVEVPNYMDNDIKELEDSWFDIEDIQPYDGIDDSSLCNNEG